MIEVWYSPKYNEFVFREFDKYGGLTALEYDDNFDIRVWEKYELNTWFYFGKL